MPLGQAMHGLTVSNVDLALVLKPAAAYLDNCWWYLGGYGMSFPAVRPPAPAPKPPRGKELKGIEQFEPLDWQRYLDEMRAASDEYGNWLVGQDVAAYRVGKPGFFSRYASGMDGNWAMYCASDALELTLSSFEEFVRRFERHWFAPPPDGLPGDICLIARDVDAAYLDLFFRDEWMFKSVWSFLRGKGMKPAEYRRKDTDWPHR